MARDITFILRARNEAAAAAKAFVADMQRAGVSTRELRDNVAEASKATGTFGPAMSEAARSTTELAGQMRDAGVSVTELKEGIEGVASSTDEARDAAGKAAEAASDITSEMGKAGVSTEDVSDAAGRAAQAVDDVKTAATGAAGSMGDLKDEASDAADEMEGMRATAEMLGTVLGKIARYAAGALSVAGYIKVADAWSDMQSQLGAATGDMEHAGDMMLRMAKIANASYSPLNQTVETYARNVSVLKELGYTANQVADFTESLNHMLVITATKGQEAAAVQDALTRAMAVGKLSGLGLETVLARGGRVAQALADELGITRNQLRQAAKEGKITADVIANALLKSLEDVRAEAEEMPATVADGFQRIKTGVSVLIGRFDQALGISEKLAKALVWVGDALLRIAEIDFDKWGGAILGVLALIGGAFLKTFGGRTIGLIGKVFGEVTGLSGAMKAAGGVAAATGGKIGILGRMFGLLSRLIGGVGIALRGVPYLGWALIAIDAIKALMDVTFEWKEQTISLGSVFTVLADNIIGAFSLVYDYLSGVFNTIWDSTLGAVMSFVDSAIQGIYGLAESIQSAFAEAATYFAPLMDALTGIAEFIVGLGVTIYETVASIVASIVDGFSALSSTIAGVFQSVYAAITGWLAPVIDYISGWVDTIVGFFDTMVSSILSALGGLPEIARVISDALSAAIDVVLGWADTIVGAFIGLVKAIGVVLGGLGAVIGGAFAKALNAASAIVEQGLNYILGGFKTFLGALDSAAGAVGADLNLAGMIGEVSIGKVGEDLIAEAGKVGEDAAAAFRAGLGSKPVSGAISGVGGWISEIRNKGRGAIDAAAEFGSKVVGVVGDAVSGVLDEAGRVEEAAARAKAAKDALTDDTGTVTLPDTGTGAGSGKGGAGKKAGGGGGGAGAAEKERDLMQEKADLMDQILSKYDQEIALAQYAGREYELQKATLDAINAAKQKGLELSAEELELVRQSANAALDIQRARDMIKGYSDLLQSSLADGIKSALDSGRLDMESFISELGRKLRDMAIDNFVKILFEGGNGFGGITNWLQGAFGGGGGGGGGGLLGGLFKGIGSFFSSIFGFSEGGIMSARGPIPLRRYAKGGIAYGPQMAMFGEGSVPEAYVPVPSGHIPVELNDSGRQKVVNNNFNFQITTPDANSFRKSQPQILANAARQLTRQSARNN